MALLTTTQSKIRSGTGAIGPVAATATPSPRHWTGANPDNRWVAAARQLAPRFAERAVQHDREGTFVADCFDELRDQGFMALLVPTELGGGGASHAEACAVLSELARGCPSSSLSFSMHSHVVGAQVWRHHRDLPAPVLGKVATSQMTLISTGASDWIESSGNAVKVDGGFRVSAHKTPASGCCAGDVLVTSICWFDAVEGAQVIHCSIPFSADGVSILPTWDTMGMRGTGSDTVALDDVFVPDESVALVRPAGVWHPVWSTVLGTALPLIMSTYVGIAESAAERALELAAHRAERPDVAQLVGRMLNRLAVGRDTVRAMIDASDNLHFATHPRRPPPHSHERPMRPTRASTPCASRSKLEVATPSQARPESSDCSVTYTGRSTTRSRRPGRNDSPVGLRSACTHSAVHDSTLSHGAAAHQAPPTVVCSWPVGPVVTCRGSNSGTTKRRHRPPTHAVTLPRKRSAATLAPLTTSVTTTAMDGWSLVHHLFGPPPVVAPWFGQSNTSPAFGAACSGTVGDEEAMCFPLVCLEGQI